jgi:hypothetical protein
MKDLERVAAIQIGSAVTNICTSETSPYHHMKFMGVKTKSYKNKYKVLITERFAKCKCKEGKLHDFGLEVIYAGMLDVSTCKELWQPVWQRRFGKVATPQSQADLPNNQ